MPVYSLLTLTVSIPPTWRRVYAHSNDFTSPHVLNVLHVLGRD